MLYTNTPHDELLANSIIEFAFRGDTRDKICAVNNYACWIKNNSNNYNRYFLTYPKRTANFLLEIVS